MWSYEFNLLYDKKYKHEVWENRKVLAPITDTIITLRSLGSPFLGHRDDSEYYPIVGEYSTDGFNKFVEFLQLFQKLHRKIWLVVAGNLLQILLQNILLHNIITEYIIYYGKLFFQN